MPASVFVIEYLHVFMCGCMCACVFVIECVCLSVFVCVCEMATVTHMLSILSGAHVRLQGTSWCIQSYHML